MGSKHEICNRTLLRLGLLSTLVGRPGIIKHLITNIYIVFPVKSFASHSLGNKIGASKVRLDVHHVNGVSHGADDEG